MQNISIFPGSLIVLKNLLNEIKPKKIYLVTGRDSFSKSGAKDKLGWMDSKYNVIHFSDFNTNPTYEDVIRGVKKIQKEECDLLLSIGGGSTIDITKLINYYRNIPTEKISKKNTSYLNFIPLRHISIPLTAGSGSESTHFAVVYQGNEKFSIANEKLLPEFVIIDPELHLSQSNYQKAVSGIDALAQAIESYWSVNSTEESLKYSDTALKLIWSNLNSVVNGNDINSALLLSLGANLAGKAINITKTTAPHAFSYGFTKFAGLPHGHAVALTLKLFTELNYNVNETNCNDIRGVDHVSAILNKVLNIIESSESFNNLFKNIKIETDIKKLNITNSILKKVVNNVNIERLVNNPVKIDKSEIIRLLTNRSDDYID